MNFTHPFLPYFDTQHWVTQNLGPKYCIRSQILRYGLPEDFLSEWTKKLKETDGLVVLSAALQQKIHTFSCMTIFMIVTKKRISLFFFKAEM